MIPGFPATAPPGSPLTFSRLKWTSFVHSAVYLALLIAAFAATAVRLRIVPLRVGVAVAVLGGIGPFFGSIEFVREQRRRAAPQALNGPR